MKILLVNTIKYNINGIANVILAHCKGLKILQPDIQIDITCNGELAEVYKTGFDQLGVNVINVCSRKNIFKYCRQLKKIAKEGYYDIIHIHGNNSLMYLEVRNLKKYRTKIIVHAHTTSTKHEKLHKLFMPKLKNYADMLLSCSKEAGEFCFKDNFTIVNNGMDIDKFVFDETQRDILRKRYNLQDKVVVLHTGLFNYQKNHQFMLQLAEQMDNEKFVFAFVGGGELFEDVKRLAEQKHILDKILFLGLQNDPSKFYSMADCFILPSRYEAFGLVLVEAQINGLKCIASNAVSRDSLVNDKLVDYLPLNEEVWIDKLETLGNRKKEYQDLKMYDKFSLITTAGQVLEIYKNIL